MATGLRYCTAHAFRESSNSVIADFIRCGIEPTVARNELATAFQQGDHRLEAHAGCRARSDSKA
jgi:hypothetical protein